MNLYLFAKQYRLCLPGKRLLLSTINIQANELGLGVSLVVAKRPSISLTIGPIWIDLHLVYQADLKED